MDGGVADHGWLGANLNDVQISGSTIATAGGVTTNATGGWRLVDLLWTNVQRAGPLIDLVV